MREIKMGNLVTDVRRRTGSFVARQRFLRSIRATDVFIVTYPKSGTNWVGFFLANLLLMNDPTQLSELTLRNYRNHIPDINPDYARRESLDRYNPAFDPRVFTVHAPYDRHLANVVYVVRDPRDTILSYYYYHVRNIPNFSETKDEFVRREDLWPCDWGTHVSGWVDNGKPDRALIIRYEDLRANTVELFHNVVDFCGIRCSQEELERAVALSSFDHMRELEQRFGIKDVRGDRSVPYMRRGQPGSWRDELSEESIAIIERRFSAQMKRLGYSAEVAANGH